MKIHISFPKKVRQKIFAKATGIAPKNISSATYKKNILYVLFPVLLAGLLSLCFAQQEANLPQQPAPLSDANAVGTLSFPYFAEITGNDVYIRSGPGTDHYYCGKLNKGDRVKVVSKQFGWSRIVPPVGSFSWISMQYISVNLDDPVIGAITGDDVRVYAGSDYFEPIHSNALQLRLNRGYKVKLLGEEKDGYYKIAPPTGAYLWVSTQYTKLISPVQEMPITVIDTNDVTPITPEISIEDKKLEEFYDLQKKLEAERTKPLEKQNYSEIKKALVKISENKEAGKAVSYAEFAIKQIEGFELVLSVTKELKLQNENLQQICQKIDKARDKKLSEVEDLGRFIVIGQFQGSSIYDAEGELKRYRIIDETGTTICYARPIAQALKINLGQLIDKKVGLVGKIEPHLPTAGALVLFSEIVELK